MSKWCRRVYRDQGRVPFSAAEEQIQQRRIQIGSQKIIARACGHELYCQVDIYAVDKKKKKKVVVIILEHMIQTIQYITTERYGTIAELTRITYIAQFQIVSRQCLRNIVVWGAFSQQYFEIGKGWVWGCLLCNSMAVQYLTSWIGVATMHAST